MAVHQSKYEARMTSLTTTNYPTLCAGHLKSLFIEDMVIYWEITKEYKKSTKQG